MVVPQMLATINHMSRDQAQAPAETMSPELASMVAVARDFCLLVEGVNRADSTWLKRMSQLLPQLHAAVAALGIPDDEISHSLRPDLDARFELFAELRELLGERDAYWMEFDVGQEAHHKSGSLADDLTDIYCELKHGLRTLEEEPSVAYDDWRSGFRLHWGRHLVDAERHLFELGLKGQL